jgi:multiple sugar transport system permease protein
LKKEGEVDFMNIIKPDLKPKRSSNIKLKSETKENIQAWTFVGIGFLLFCVFVLYPQLKNFYMAFTQYSVMPGVPSKFVGLDNFKMMFFSNDSVLSESKYFLTALRNSFLAVVVTVPSQMIVGLFLAVFIHNLTKGKTLYKVLLYIPVITSTLIVSILFKFIFQDTKGSLANFALTSTHLISSPIAWLQGTWTANIVIWLLCVWKGVGWVIIIYTAALQGLPKDIYEAARIEGASAWQTFKDITVPLLKSTTLYVTIQLTIGAFNIMLQVMLITGGAPMGTTDVLLNYMYNKAFTSFQFGYASAVSVIMGMVIIAITIRQRKVLTSSEMNF